MGFTDSGASVKAVDLITQALASKSITLYGPSGTSSAEEGAKRDSEYLVSLFKQLHAGLCAQK